MVDQAGIDALRAGAIAPQGLFVDGAWQEGSDPPLPVLSPIDGRALTTLASATPADVDRAVAAARRAFERGAWSRAAPAARKAVLVRLAELIERDALELAVLGVRDNGTEIAMALEAEPGSAAASFRYYAEAIDKVYGEIAPTPDSVLGLIHREPVDVVGAIVPWNFPLMIGAWKLAPALAMGNSVVLKPAETASLTLLRLAELAAEVGLPEGVLNVVTGPGAVTGAALALSMDVDVLVFTGSGATGRRLLEHAARSNLKRVFLELGGKSPNIVFGDARDFDRAARVSAAAMFRNAGQVCVAGSRLLVERAIHDDFVAALSDHAAAMRVGDPLDLSSDIGAVHSEAGLHAHLAVVREALDEGAGLATGGARLLEESGGWYMAPTVLTGVRPGQRVARDEVFGPVLAVTAFDSEEDALRLANDTPLGLAAGVWMGDLSRAHRMIRAVRAGWCMSTPMTGRTTPCRWAACASPATAMTSRCTHWTSTAI